MIHAKKERMMDFNHDDPKVKKGWSGAVLMTETRIGDIATVRVGSSIQDGKVSMVSLRGVNVEVIEMFKPPEGVKHSVTFVKWANVLAINAQRPDAPPRRKVLQELMQMAVAGWKYELRSSTLEGAAVVIRAHKSPYGRMYGYGNNGLEALKMMQRMIVERIEELVTNKIFCPYCKGEGHVAVPDGFRFCHECNGTGKSKELLEDDKEQARGADQTKGEGAGDNRDGDESDVRQSGAGEELSRRKPD